MSIADGNSARSAEEIHIAVNFWRALPFLDDMTKLPPVISLAAALALMSIGHPQALQAMGPDGAGSDDHPVAAFTDDGLDGWEERSFNGNTQYELVSEKGVSVLKAHTVQQASVLFREETINILETPVLSWSWKVDRVYTDIDEKTKKGDDFPARLYVVKEFGFLPWESYVITYIWASESPVGDIWTNPYTDNGRMVVLQSGDAYMGEWRTQSRNVAQDFKNLFDLDVEEIDGYAVMVDGDNTKVEAVAWFGAINFLPLQAPLSEQPAAPEVQRATGRDLDATISTIAR